RSLVSGRPRGGALAGADRAGRASRLWVGGAPAGRLAVGGRGRGAGRGADAGARTAASDPQRLGPGQRGGVSPGPSVDCGLGRRRALERGRGGRPRGGELVQRRRRRDRRTGRAGAGRGLPRGGWWPGGLLADGVGRLVERGG